METVRPNQAGRKHTPDTGEVHQEAPSSSGLNQRQNIPRAHCAGVGNLEPPIFCKTDGYIRGVARALPVPWISSNSITLLSLMFSRVPRAGYPVFSYVIDQLRAQIPVNRMVWRAVSRSCLKWLSRIGVSDT